MYFLVRHASLIAFVSTLAWAIPSVAQTGLATPPVEGDVFGPNEPQRALKAGKVVHAVRVAAPPTIDGRLDDEPWIVAPAAVDLTQRDPDNGQAMTRATRIQFAYDDRYLYVAVTCVDDSGDVVATGLGRRDELPPTDMVTLAFDPRHDHQTGYAFQTNPSGWQGDFSTTDDDRNDRDYNGVWDVRTTVTATGLSAEFRIPFSQVRFTASPEPGQVWGVNVQRQIRRLSENGTWVSKPRGQRGEVSLYGHLIFEQPIAPPRRLELTPYVAARTTHQPNLSQDGGASTGVDLRLGVGTGATLSATVNPDFGQGNFQLFHSRRIGRTPGRLLTLESGEQDVEKPNETTILGAAKLTGKSSQWTYGALTAVTGREYADIDTPVVDGTGFTRQERLIEPATSYNVLRLQRDIGASNIGALVTGVLREKAQDAFTGGFDYNLRWGLWGFGSYSQGWTDEGLRIERYFETDVSFQLLNYWNFNGGGGRNGDAYDDLDTRGGPPIFNPGNNFMFFNANSDSRKSWRVNLGGNRWRDAVGGSGSYQSVGLTVQPTDRVQASVSASYSEGTDDAQWIVNEDADGDTVTDYVYGALDRRVVDVTFRGTYAFNRDLTLQAYVQPFVAVGDYSDVRKLALPYSYLFSPVTISYDPDFNTKSLRGNVVLRWEYVRGSTLFVVWDVSQADYSRPGVFRPWSDIGTAFGAEPTHTLMVKVSYWINQ